MELWVGYVVPHKRSGADFVLEIIEFFFVFLERSSIFFFRSEKVVDRSASPVDFRSVFVCSLAGVEGFGFVSDDKVEQDREHPVVSMVHDFGEPVVIGFVGKKGGHFRPIPLLKVDATGTSR